MQNNGNVGNVGIDISTNIHVNIRIQFCLDYLDPGYSTNGNLTISSNNRQAIVTPHQIFQRHIAKMGLAKRD